MTHARRQAGTRHPTWLAAIVLVLALAACSSERTSATEQRTQTTQPSISTQAQRPDTVAAATAGRASTKTVLLYLKRHLGRGTVLALLRVLRASPLVLSAQLAPDEPLMPGVGGVRIRVVTRNRRAAMAVANRVQHLPIARSALGGIAVEVASATITIPISPSKPRSESLLEGRPKRARPCTLRDLAPASFTRRGHTFRGYIFQSAGSEAIGGIDLRNVSRDACSLSGYPLVTFLAANGKTIVRAVPSAGRGFYNSPVLRQPLQPKRAAGIIVQYGDWCSPGQSGTPERHFPQPSFLRLELPHARGAFTFRPPRGIPPPCKDQLVLVNRFLAR